MTKSLASAILAGWHFVVALGCLAVVLTTWALGRPLAVIGDLPPWVPVALFLTLAPGIVLTVVEQFRERFGDDDTEPRADGWWAGLRAAAIGLAVVGVVVGVMSFGSPGAPITPRDGCAYPLRESGENFACVSAADYRQAGAGGQRRVAALALVFAAGSAGAFLTASRRQRPV